MRLNPVLALEKILTPACFLPLIYNSLLYAKLLPALFLYLAVSKTCSVSNFKS